MNRRDIFHSAAALLLVRAGFPAKAQGQKVWRIGYLSSRKPDPEPNSDTTPFLQAMRELGYVEGKNLVIDWRFADGDYDRLPAMAAELVKLKPDVIVAGASPAIRAAQKATTTIPIVFPNTGDPVSSGFVAKIGRAHV